MNYQDRDNEALDALLDGSAPQVSAVTRERSTAMGALLDEVRPVRPRRSWRTWAAFGGAALLLGAGGVATAESRPWESWWADDAVTELSYTLPSGAVCTGILGNVYGPEESVEAAEEFLARPDLLEILEPAIEAQVGDLVDAVRTAELADGQTVDAGPGTPYWSDDVAYHDAVWDAAVDAMYAQLEEDGYEIDGLSISGEERCPALVPAESDDYDTIESRD